MSEGNVRVLTRVSPLQLSKLVTVTLESYVYTGAKDKMHPEDAMAAVQAVLETIAAALESGAFASKTTD